MINAARIITYNLKWTEISGKGVKAELKFIVDHGLYII